MSQKKMQLGSPNLTHKCSTMSPGNPFILGSKGQRSKSQRLYRSSDRTQYCRCCVRKLCWVFPAVMHRRTSNASDTGVSLRHFLTSACSCTLGFPRRGFFHCCDCRLVPVTSMSSPTTADAVRKRCCCCCCCLPSTVERDWRERHVLRLPRQRR